jgi:aldehyde:ferredoxin oxidoreductase
MKSVRDQLLDVDLTTKKIKVVPVKNEYRKHYLGGKGLALRVLYDYLEVGIDPLSPRNVIVFMTGPLSGTGAPSADKFEVVTKSPLTGIMVSSSCGGSFGYQLKRAGYDGLIVRGSSDVPVYIYIDSNKVEILEAGSLWALTTEEAQKRIKQGNEGVVVIGPAGENLVKYACIRSGDRFAGRAGCGAVMGSKKLKAVVVRGSQHVTVTDKNRLKETVKVCKERITKSPVTGGSLAYLGTPSWVNVCNEFNMLPTRHFTFGSFDRAEQISGEFIRENYFDSNTGCHGCSVRCGSYLILNTKQFRCPEYAGIAALGSNLMIGDVEQVIELNELCNQLGMDVISTGVILAYAMELQERGIINASLAFGDFQSAKEMIFKIAYQDGLGANLSQGVRWYSEECGGKKYALHIKGLEMTTHDPRAIFGDALAYATANRGACHLSGNTFATDLIYGLMDPLSVKGKPEWVKFTQDAMDFINSIVLCSFITMPLFMEEPLVKKIPLAIRRFLAQNLPTFALRFSNIDLFLNLLSGALGEGFTKKQCLTIGERIFNLERMMNVREGISSKDDQIPQRMLEEDLPGIGKVKIPIEKMLKRYYKLRNWEENGIPTKEKLKQLNISC